MNIVNWMLMATTMFPRDIKISKDYVKINAMVEYWNYRGYTVHQLFDSIADAHPQKIAIRLDENAWTNQMLKDYSLQVANYFKMQGLQAGDVVALYMGNKPRYVGLWLGLARLGVVTALVNTGQQQQPLQHSVNIVHSKALICDIDLLPVLKELQESEYKLDPSVVIYGSGPANISAVIPGSINLDPLLLKSSRKPIDSSITRTLNMRTKFLYIYTSGTTGLPKAAVMTYRRFAFLVTAIHETLDMVPSDVMYTPLPLYHTSGGLLGTGQLLFFGNTLVIRTKFSASNYFSDCRAYGVTVAQYIGEMCSYLMTQIPSEKDRDHKVRLMFGNGLRKQIWEPFKSRYGIKQIGEFYGSTEGNANMINNYNKPGSIGFLPWYASLLYSLPLLSYDPDSSLPLRNNITKLCIPAKSGEPGILVSEVKKGSATKSFEGYADAEATKAKLLFNVFKMGDTYFNTGDVLFKDDYGFYFFVDRLGDTYRWKGENVASSEVEAIIVKNAVIPPNQVAVYGVKIPNKDGKAGMLALALPEEKHSASLPVRIQNVVEKNLFPTQIPLFLRIMDAFPTTSTEKVKKSQMQAEGFDPEVINADKKKGTEDVLYFYSGSTIGYVPMNTTLYQMICEGNKNIKL